MAYYIYYTLYIILMRVYTESPNHGGEKGKVKFPHMRWETDLDISVL